MSNSETHVRQLSAIAKILLGIAYADRRFDAVEYDAIRAILSTFAKLDELPSEVIGAIHDFDADAFSLDEAIAALDIPPDNRAPLLKMVLAVADADLVRDPQERHYFHRLAKAIGASDDEITAVLGE